MQKTFQLLLITIISLFLLSCQVAPKPTLSFVTEVYNIIPGALSEEEHQDSEPFLSVDRVNPNNIVASAFTPNLVDAFGNPIGNAPIFVSNNRGMTWKLVYAVQSSSAFSGTGDITTASGLDINATGMHPAALYVSILRQPFGLRLSVQNSPSMTNPGVLAVLDELQNVDQPFIQTANNLDPSIPIVADRIYIGNNDFNAPGGRTASVDISLDGGTTFTQARIETRATMGQNGPSVRPAISRDGTVYAAYFGWRSVAPGNLITSDVVVVRDDNGVSPFFTDLISGGFPGVFVASGVIIPWVNGPALGQERIGSSLSIAVDPYDSDRVYVAWADRVGTGDIYTIHLRFSDDRGVTWSSDVRTITNGTAPSVAIADNGTVGFLYHQLVNGRWVTLFEESFNDFNTHLSAVLATVPANQPSRQFFPYMGDYNFLTAVGVDFYGIFSTNNDPKRANFPSGVVYFRYVDLQNERLLDLTRKPTVAVSIDPFFFRAKALSID